MPRSPIGQIRTGDRIVVDGRRVGDGARRGEVIEVLGEPGYERCRVEWDDGSETLVYPGADVRVERRAPQGHEELE